MEPRPASEAFDRERLEQLLETLYESAAARAGRETLSLHDWLRHAEAWRIRLALAVCEGRRSAAARRLGIPRRSLYHRMQLLGIGGGEARAGG